MLFRLTNIPVDKVLTDKAVDLGQPPDGNPPEGVGVANWIQGMEHQKKPQQTQDMEPQQRRKILISEQKIYLKNYPLMQKKRLH